jgi:hypothetical protein
LYEHAAQYQYKVNSRISGFHRPIRMVNLLIPLQVVM